MKYEVWKCGQCKKNWVCPIGWPFYLCPTDNKPMKKIGVLDDERELVVTDERPV